MPLSNIKIFIVEENFVWASGLKSLVQKHFEAAQFVIEPTLHYIHLESFQPDILIIDTENYRINKPDILSLINKLPKIKIINISNSIEKKRIIDSIEMGVISYLLKDCNETEIITSIKLALKNEKYIPGKVLDILLKKQRTPEKTTHSLTTREIEIIQMITKGFSSKEISSILNVSTHTISSHRKNIFKKLNIHSTQELIIFGLNQEF